MPFGKFQNPITITGMTYRSKHHAQNGFSTNLIKSIDFPSPSVNIFPSARLSQDWLLPVNYRSLKH